MGEVDDVPKSYYDMIASEPKEISKPIESISGVTAQSILSNTQQSNINFTFQSHPNIDWLNELFGIKPNKYHQKTNYKPKYTL